MGVSGVPGVPYVIGCMDHAAGPFGPSAWVGQHSVGRKTPVTGWIGGRKDDLSGVWRRRVGWKGPEVGAGVQDSVSWLGFAALSEIRTGEASAAFARAIELASSDPLPRLGLGLAKIRDGDLTSGRKDLEVAVALDSGNALMRSYLGKSYFEEKRAPLDAEQFAIAKQLDPLDPTPYFYDALRKQSEGDPVGALVFGGK